MSELDPVPRHDSRTSDWWKNRVPATERSEGQKRATGGVVAPQRRLSCQALARPDMGLTCVSLRGWRWSSEDGSGWRRNQLPRDYGGFLRGVDFARLRCGIGAFCRDWFREVCLESRLEIRSESVGKGFHSFAEHAMRCMGGVSNGEINFAIYAIA